MCVTFLCIDNEPDSNYKLILVNNRDEQLDRITSAAKWERGILAGRDEKDQCRGTWLCTDQKGRIGNLLTITVPFHQRKIKAPSRGVHGFGNCPPDKPFLKVQHGISLMQQVVEDVKCDDLNEKEVIERLLKVVTDRYMCYPDEQLRKQIGRSGEICKYRSSIYVQYPDGIRFGTRSHTVILVDRSNHMTFYEKRMAEAPIRLKDAKWADNIFHFDLSTL
uniref:Transport and Golgi organization protein 2 homolog n=1 Tax=Syphacia muris TaxID=451379 RepID=A0A0N5AYT6_9BILA